MVPLTIHSRPMMIFSAAPFIGPVLGPLVSGFINEHTNWRWTYYVIIIWAAVMLVLLLVFVPESYSPELLRRKAKRLRKETGDERWISPVEKLNRTFWEALKKSIKTPFSESGGCFTRCLTESRRDEIQALRNVTLRCLGFRLRHLRGHPLTSP
jgi:MFS family permease